MRGKGQYWDAQAKLFSVYAKRFGFNEHRVGSDNHARADFPASQPARISVRLDFLHLNFRSINTLSADPTQLYRDRKSN